MKRQILLLIAPALVLSANCQASAKTPPNPQGANSYNAQFASAVQAYQNRNYSAALNQFSALSQRYSDCRLQYYMALCYQAQGQLDQARDEYHWVSKYAPEPYCSMASQGYSRLKTLRKQVHKGWEGSEPQTAYHSGGNSGGRHNEGTGNDRRSSSSSSSRSSSFHDDFWETVERNRNGWSKDGTKYESLTKNASANLDSHHHRGMSKVSFHASNGKDYDGEKSKIDKMRGWKK
jgi:hypothetical protein